MVPALLTLACRAGIGQAGHRIRTNHAESGWIMRWHPERVGEDGIHRDDLDRDVVLNLGVVGRNYEATGWLAGFLRESDNGSMSRIVGRNDDASIRPWIARGARKQYDISDDGPPGPPSRAGILEQDEQARNCGIGLLPRGVRRRVRRRRRNGSMSIAGNDVPGRTGESSAFFCSLWLGSNCRLPDRDQLARQLRPIASKQCESGRPDRHGGCNCSNHSGQALGSFVFALDRHSCIQSLLGAEASDLRWSRQEPPPAECRCDPRRDLEQR